MTDGSLPEIPFQINDWVLEKQNPGLRGQYTGKCGQRGEHLIIEIRYPDGSLKRRRLQSLQQAPQEGASSIESRLKSGSFGKVQDLRRLITFEKLKGALNEVVYSMEAAQIDFYPYQYKPVLKFINSPTERMIIADEVGLGKTIESALIWIELQARRQARRLLVICTSLLTKKWKDELRDKFLLDARIVDFNGLEDEIDELRKRGAGHSCVLISSYHDLRPPKKELSMLDTPPGEDDDGTKKTRLLRELRHWDYEHPPFDLVIFDEAHHMRNAVTSAFHLGESVSAHNDTGVLCVTATPVNNNNTDLYSLLRLVDRNFFESKSMFEELLEANRPAVQAINALSRTPVDMVELKSAVDGMAKSPFVKGSPLFDQFLDLSSELEKNSRDIPVLARAQEVAEKLNLMGGYINRTRRIQIEEDRPVRETRVISVEYAEDEMKLYKCIRHLVRLRCQRDRKPLHVFKFLGLQLRAASCLPVIADRIRNGSLKTLGKDLDEMTRFFISETLQDAPFFLEDSYTPPTLENELLGVDFKDLIQKDFEALDTKFKKLLKILKEVEEKIIIFAHNPETLEYLKRRLESEGIEGALIHGKIKHEHRWKELERFKDPQGPRILFASEVGNEGIDLQFCRVVVNYDLPWNPMRVEQRIGRIDRVGQEADKLLIFNFKVKDTVEERLYDRLHKKLLLFKNSLGDLEAVIESEIDKLTSDLMSKNLSPEQERNRIADTQKAIETLLRQTQELEESGDTLVGLSDYVQKKISENRDRGRYIQAEELKDYLSDFFTREFKEVKLNYDTPADGCIHIALSKEARTAFSNFAQKDPFLSAHPFHNWDFSITFSREVHEHLPEADRRRVQFVNHLSPLIKWITSHNRQRPDSFYNVSALQLEDDEIPQGEYAYRIRRWSFEGVTQKEFMVSSIKPILDGTPMDAEQSEIVMQKLLREGVDWDCPDCDPEKLFQAHQDLGENLESRFWDELQNFEAENSTTNQIKRTRVKNHWDSRIKQSLHAIDTMLKDNRPVSMIRARGTRLDNERKNKKQIITEMKRDCEVDFTEEEVAAGVFKVTRPEA